MAQRPAVLRFRSAFWTAGAAPGAKVARSFVALFGLWVASCSSELPQDSSAPPGPEPTAPIAPRIHAATDEAPARQQPSEPRAESSPAKERATEAAPPTALPAEDAAADTASEEGDTALPTLPTPVPSLFATQREVFVFEKPALGSKKLGYLRAGARVVRSTTAVGFEGCPGGFFGIAPEGFVCAGPGAKLESGDKVSELLSPSADRLSPLPFVYARVRHPLPPIYTQLPTAQEERAWEPALSGKPFTNSSFADLPSRITPEWLLTGTPLPTLFGSVRDPSRAVTRRAIADSSFALLSVFERGPRRFGLLSDLTLVPLDRLERVRPSTFHGLSLDGVDLPVAFVMKKGGLLYSGSQTVGLSQVRPLAYREAIPITGERVDLGGYRYLKTIDGHLLRDDGLLQITPMATLPRWARGERSWIHVSIENQALVAYRGQRPVYVTLVSAGADGLGDPETTRSTVLGQFLVHTKQVTTAMTSDAAGDEYALLDVPWVQYFSANYAFHAAYWHDGFGSPRSHGCINLSPRDARFLFNWTDPPVPQGWHGSFSLRAGTLVHITP